MKIIARLVFVLFLAAGLALPAYALAHAVAKVVRVSGKVTMKAHPKDPPILLTPGHQLTGGTQLDLAPGAVLEILKPAPGNPAKEVLETYTAPLTATITVKLPLADDPRVANLQSNVLEILVGGVGGLSRGGDTPLYAPANRARLIPGVPVALRWEPGPSGSQIRIAVVTDRGDPVWDEEYPADRARETNAELGQALQAASARGARFFSFQAGLAGTELDPAAITQCTLLSAARAAELQSNLALCDDAPAPWRHVLRAAVFGRYSVTEAALQEFEQVIADPELAKQPEFLFVAARLHEDTGNLKRAEALRQAALNLAPK